MKQLAWFSFFLFISFLASSPLLAVHPTPVESSTIQEGPLAGLSIEQALTTDYKTLKAEKGIRLSFFQRIALKSAQRKYKKAKKRGESIDFSVTKSGNALSITSLVLGLTGFVFAFIPFIAILSPFMAITAIILGAIGLKRESKRGMAVTGIVMGSLTILLFIIGLVVLSTL